MSFDMTVENISAFLTRGGRAEQVAAMAYDRIEAYADPAVWITLRSRAEVLAEARAQDDQGGALLPLQGVPFAVKDNIDVAGLPTSAACPEFTYLPAEDSPSVARLRAAGAIVMGKANLDQFATGLVGTRSPHGAPRSVFDADYISGGSSSGSAVAVAAGLVAFSLGTDTKPTKGLLSTRGVVPACRSLDCVTIFAASAGEGTLLRHIAQGFDAADIYSRPSQSRRLPGTGLRIGVPFSDQREFYGNSAYDRLYARAMAEARDLGYEIVDIDFAPFRDAAKLLYGGPWVAERLAALEGHLDHYPGSFDPTVRQIVEGARGITAVDAFRGQYELARLKQLADAQWARVDVLMLPTAPTIHKVEAVMADPIKLNAQLGHYTNFVNLLDCCAIAVPAGFTEANLPFGVTLVGPAFSDDDLAIAADRLHRGLEPGFGGLRRPLPSQIKPEPDRNIALAVVGAHLSGQPLHGQLVERDARLLARTRTASHYRLFALANTTPAKPGLVADPDFSGDGIEVEVWAMDTGSFGDFTASVPRPLAIGSVELMDGSVVKGFVCEPAALKGAQDITAYGGWRGYLDRKD